MAFLCALIAGGPAAATRVTSVGDFLREDRGGRIPAYGGSGVALSGDLGAAASNPAALAGLDRYQIAFEHNDIVLDIAGNYAAVGGAWGRHMAWGLSYAGVDYGSVLRTTVADPLGGANSTFTGDDLAMNLGLAARVGYYGHIHLGADMKYYRLKIDHYEANGAAFNLGLQYAIYRTNGEFTGWRVGGSLSNLGFKAKFRNAEENLPITWRVGGAYTGEFMGFDLESTADLVTGVGEPTNVRLGVGISPVEWLTLRGGWNSLRHRFGAGLSGGMGFRWKDVTLDYAYLPFGDFGSQNRVSLAYDWGQPREPIRPDRGIVPPPSAIVEKPAPVVIKRLPEPEVKRPAAPVEEIKPAKKPVSKPASKQKPEKKKKPVAAPAVDTAAAAMTLGNQLTNKGEYARAIESYRQVISVKPSSAPAWFNLGTAQFLMQDYLAAENAFKTAIELRPEDAEAYFYAGVCRFKLGDRKASLRWMKKVIEIDPTNESAKKYVAALSVKKK